MLNNTIPENWKTALLGDIADITTGKLNANAMVENGQYPFFTCARESYKIDTYAFDTEALLISGNGANVGYIHYYNGKFNAYQRTYVLDNFKTNILYIYYALKNFLHERIASQVRGDTPYIVMGTLSGLELPIPPMCEQERIVGVLDSVLADVDSVIEKTEQSLKNTADLFQSILQQKFSNPDWKTALLGEICENLDNKRVPITKNKRISGDIPYYGATGIVDYVNDYLFNERLLLVGEDGAKWGAGDNTAFIIDGKSWVNNHAHILKVKDNIKDVFLMYYLNVSDLSEFITGVTVPKLNQGNLKNIQIPVPPLHEQNRIVAELETIKAHITELQNTYTKKLAHLHDLKQSVLQSAFRGALSNLT